MFSWLWKFWRKPKPEKQQPEKQPARRDYEAETNRHYYLGDILDQLDEYFHIIGKVAVHDPHGYALYAQVGGVLAPAGAAYTKDNTKVPPWWGDGPSFLCTYWADDWGPEKVTIRLSYIVKEALPLGGEQTYRLVAWYIKDNLKLPLEMWFTVDDGCITPRRRPKTDFQHLPNGGRVPHRKWLYGTEVLDKAEEDGPLALARFIISVTIEHAEGGLSGAQINVRNKSGRAAIFGIDMLRTPYFFKDRDLYVTENGKRKRIFHIVRTHSRNTKRGKQTVRSHFRGQRRFRWNGYNVTISIPGLHHTPLEDLTLEATDRPSNRRMISRGKAARMVGEALV